MKLLKLIALTVMVPAFGTAYAQSPAGQTSKAECDAAWKTAGSSGDVDMKKAAPYITDFKKADKNADGKLTPDEWTAACDMGMIKASTTTNDTNLPVNEPGGKTSDRTPGDAGERTPNAGTAGPAGTTGQTPSGTSDRTPDSK